MLGFVTGDYVLVGREPDDGVAYSGSAHIERRGNGLLMKRWRGGREITAEGRLEVPSPPGEAQVLRFRWTDPKAMLMTCLIDGDLDNYPRLTCLWARDDIKPATPGLEALFPKK